MVVRNVLMPTSSFEQIHLFKEKQEEKRAKEIKKRERL